MPVLVTGARRSGTSMAIKALRDSGVWLGTDDNFAKAYSQNPKGFWEHISLWNLANKVMESVYVDFSVDGIYPYHSLDWDKVDGNLQKELALITDTLQRESVEKGFSDWGFKAPMMSLAIPYWYHFIPNLKIVIMFRHPAESALSLVKGGTSLKEKGQSNFRYSVRLWKQTYDLILHYKAKNPDMDLLITDYRDWIQQPGCTLRDVLKFSDLPIDDTKVSKAVAEITPALYRFNKQRVSDEKYRIAEDLAGDVYEKLLGMKQIMG